MYGYNTNSNYSRAGDGVLGLLLTATATAGTPASTGRAHGPQEGEEGAGVHGCVEAKIMRGRRSCASSERSMISNRKCFHVTQSRNGAMATTYMY